MLYTREPGSKFAFIRSLTKLYQMPSSCNLQNHPNATHSSKTNSREQHHTGFQFQAAMRCQEDITFLDDPNWDQIGSQHSRQLRNAECKCCSDGQMVYFLPHCFLCARHGLRWCEQLQFAFGIMASLLKKSLRCFPTRFPEVGQALKPHSSVEETRKHLSIWHGVISSEFWVQWCQQNPADFLAGTHPTINLQQFGCQAQSS